MHTLSLFFRWYILPGNAGRWARGEGPWGRGNVSFDHGAASF